MIADRAALLATLTGPSSGHHSHPVPTPGCAACALVVITRATPRTDDGPGEGSAEAVEVPRERRNHMSNVPQATRATVPDVMDRAADIIAARGHAGSRCCEDPGGPVCAAGAVAAAVGLAADMWHHHVWRQDRDPDDPVERAWQAATVVASHCSVHVARTGDTRREAVFGALRIWSMETADGRQITTALRNWATHMRQVTRNA